MARKKMAQIWEKRMPQIRKMLRSDCLLSHQPNLSVTWSHGTWENVPANSNELGGLI